MRTNMPRPVADHKLDLFSSDWLLLDAWADEDFRTCTHYLPTGIGRFILHDNRVLCVAVNFPDHED
jgi:hypothetical protein